MKSAGVSEAPCIELVSMPQLDEARSRADDWTGTTNSAARRRAQTRLNTRAYRKRKALAKQDQSTKAGPRHSPAETESEAVIKCWDVSRQSIILAPTSRLPRPSNRRKPLLPERPARNQAHIIFPLSSDHLITLLQYNVLRGTAVNRSLISGVLFDPLDCDGEELFHVVPYPANPSLIPPALLPTILQQTIPHADWIDSFPSPEARDRLILAAGTFDEDDLWADVIGGLYEGYPDDEVERRGIIAWSPVWDITGWEMSEGFVKKWGWLFRGVPNVLDETNRWRRERGEEPLAYSDDDCAMLTAS